MAKLSDDEKQALLVEARKQYDRAMDRERDNITAAYEDLEFMAGGLAQWDAKAASDRADEGRPILTVNQLPQFVHQVTGDIRQMKPAIKVVPVDDDADPKLADIRGGMIRYIENRSDASGIYFQAADGQVAAGIGHWRVLTEYADDTTFEQELRIAAVDDGVSVLWDPDAKRLTREDAMFCFVPVDMTKDAFNAQYPNANEAGLEDAKSWTNYSEWVTDDIVRVAEYWLKKPTKVRLALTADGRTINLSEEPEAEALLMQIAEQSGSPPPRIEERDTYKICRYLITASDVLEGPEEWVGRFIPIVPVVGEEVRIGRKLIRKGIVRDAKDPQRMYNYFRSSQTEVVALQPKAPFLVTETNVAKYQDVWNNVNTKNYPFLPWEPDPKNGNAPPQRIAPAVSSQGVNEGVIQANEDLRRVIGIYDASLGAKSNETSGKAILARQREGDTGTYLYIDNFTRAVRHTGKILIDLIPHIYDTQRTIRIMGEDGKIDLMKINQEVDETGQPIMGRDGQPVMLNDMSAGAYDVVAEMGPSYTTKREEAREGMIAFLQAAPDAAPLVLDLVARAQDWPMADKFASRLRSMVPPQVAKAEQLQEQGVPDEQIQEMMSQPGPPDPAQQAQQAEMAAKAQTAELGMKVAESKAMQAEADARAAVENLQTQEQTAWAKVNEEIAIMHKKADAQIDIDRQKAQAQVEIDRFKAGMGALQQAEKHEVEMAKTADSHFTGMQHEQENHEQSIEMMRRKAEATKQTAK